jgi:NADH-quinone oxidoreductase subunit F
VQILRPIEEGQAKQGELDFLLDVCDRINGKCLCPLGDSDAIAVSSYVTKFRDEFQRHLDEGGCPFGGASSLDHLVSPVDFHPALRSGYVASERPIGIEATHSGR